MNKLTKLTWKYFIEQKCIEIIKITLYILMIGLGIIVLVYFQLFLGKLILGNESYICSKGSLLEKGLCENADYWVFGFIFSIIFPIVIAIIYKWLKSNWSKAKDKAKMEVKHG